MVYTITLNPALNRTLWVEKIQPDGSIRIEREERYAGGKGLDVSKVLTTLGVSNKALGFVVGFAGEEVEGRLLNEGISCDFIRISGETRTNIIVDDIATGAGDSAVAGFVYGLVKGKSLREALIKSVAAGTATTLRPGTALCQKKRFSATDYKGKGT